jgi:hypothetical protein
MKTARCLCVAIAACLALAPATLAQEPPKPGPEHELLKGMVGTWEATMNVGGMEAKGTMVYKMDLGGLWLTSTFEGDFGGQKFTGRGFDSYDPHKKKYVGVWIDSMSTSPMTMEGTYDKDKKVLTTLGEGPGMDGKPTKYKSEVELKDKDNMVMKMYMGDAKEPSFVITYKRKS